LDGELYSGRGKFQQVISTVKKFVPIDDEWEQIDYMVFDAPSDYMFLAPGKINNPQWTLELEDCRHLPPVEGRPDPFPYHKVLRMFELGKWELFAPALFVKQYRLPIQTEAAATMVISILDGTVAKGGEGLMLRKPESVWEPCRSHNLLKVKPFSDAEATVVGYVWGKGKLEGLMGALVVECMGRIFELSGFTDEERTLSQAYGMPGTSVSDDVTSNHFPRGSAVTFKYRELTDDGVPKEARYWRKQC
jgi:DNA ligase-1